jgi:hypothetical protein
VDDLNSGGGASRRAWGPRVEVCILKVGLKHLCFAEYYGVEGAAELPDYRIKRNREEAEDYRMLQLAGMVAYTAEETQKRAPLINMSVEELSELV